MINEECLHAPNSNHLEWFIQLTLISIFFFFAIAGPDPNLSQYVSAGLPQFATQLTAPSMNNQMSLTSMAIAGKQIEGKHAIHPLYHKIFFFRFSILIHYNFIHDFSFLFSFHLSSMSFWWTIRQMVQICSSTICHKSLLTPIWHQHFCHSVMWYRPRCSSTSKPICPNVSVLCHTIITIRHRQLSKRCMVSKSAPSGWRCNWRNRKMPQSLIREWERWRKGERLLLQHHNTHTHTQIARMQTKLQNKKSSLFCSVFFIKWIFLEKKRHTSR